MTINEGVAIMRSRREVKVGGEGPDYKERM
jgi:hypothetical protein